MLRFLLGFFLFSCSAGLFALRPSELDPNLAQALSSTAIVSTLKIDIPGFPRASNPSLIPYGKGYLLSFRYRSCWNYGLGKNSPRKDASFVGLAKLTKELKVSKNSVHLLNIYSPSISSTAEDARLLPVDGRVLIIFNDLPLAPPFTGFALYLGELIEVDGKFTLKEPAKLLRYPFAGPIEKNWSPFVEGGKLYLIYSDFPRIVLEVDPETGFCREITRTNAHSDWKWGEIRGGTPAVPIGDSFLTFFHSYIPVPALQSKVPGDVARNYVMGAYTFDREFPFAIRAMTSCPLGSLRDYEDNATKVIFPGGIAVDDYWIHVVWGKNDEQIWMTTFDREKFLNSLGKVP